VASTSRADLFPLLYPALLSVHLVVWVVFVFVPAPLSLILLVFLDTLSFLFTEDFWAFVWMPATPLQANSRLFRLWLTRQLRTGASAPSVGLCPVLLCVFGAVCASSLCLPFHISNLFSLSCVCSCLGFVSAYSADASSLSVA
jgi:hypothetical protein